MKLLIALIVPLTFVSHAAFADSFQITQNGVSYTCTPDGSAISTQPTVTSVSCDCTSDFGQTSLVRTVTLSNGQVQTTVLENFGPDGMSCYFGSRPPECSH